MGTAVAGVDSDAGKAGSCQMCAPVSDEEFGTLEWDTGSSGDV